MAISQEALRRIFKKVVKSANFMTPNILSFYDIAGGVAELSTGEGFTGKIYGVTVVKDGKHQHELSQFFYSVTEAKNYIESLGIDREE
jgi:hypothetical protein